ncbi:MAG: transcription elongation factor GreAB [Rhodopirellula sp.]|nr:transcription elongation factor GreAB [Rhodopirellula sp.]
MSSQTIMITDHDRRRLGTIFDRAYAEGMAPWERLHRLEMELDHAVGIDGGDVPADVVTMNSIVRIVDLESGEDETYTLVYPDHADITEDKISVLAPIGQAILGRREGETVAVAVPSGERWFKIEAVQFQPERSGQRHL